VLAPQAPPPVPTAKDYVEWSAKIEPDQKELAYLRVGWRGKFWPAVEEARELGRPLLLWTMNGHPLGCV
jgi:hypothetical protein